MNEPEHWTCEGPWRPESAAGTLATRRSVLLGGAAMLAGWLGQQSALAEVALDSTRPERDVLVFVFLRGGADGLNMLVPYGDDDYYRHRPGLSLAAPKDARTAASTRVSDLDGFFGLHPPLARWKPLYEAGDLAGLHAVGSEDHTRSHFEAMSALERGAAHENSGPTTGWLARHLMATARADDSPLRAVAIAGTTPDSLRGAINAVSLPTISNFRLAGDEAYRANLGRLYARGDDLVTEAGRRTLTALESLRKLDMSQYQPNRGAKYPETGLGRGLKEVAAMVHADVGLEVACLDMGGWDTHVAQGKEIGWQSLLLGELAAGITAFHTDLGAEMKRVTLVVMTEFGRTVGENAALGTDHGRASCAFVFGGAVKGGRVYGSWPGLAPDKLQDGRDLRVTTDYRDVLGEILVRRMANPDLATVFPGHRPSMHGLFG